MLTLKRTNRYIIVLAVIGLLCAVSAMFSSGSVVAASQPQLDQPRNDGGPAAAPSADVADTAGSSVFTMPEGPGEKGKAAAPVNGDPEVYKTVQDGEGDSK